MNRVGLQLVAVALAGLLVSACATQTVKSTTYTPVIQDTEYLPEELLLDVGILVFDQETNQSPVDIQEGQLPDLIGGLPEFSQKGFYHVAVDVGMLGGDVKKDLARQNHQRASGFGDHGGAAGVAVEQAHLAERVERVEPVDHELPARRVRAQGLGLALDQDVKTIRLVSLADHQGVPGHLTLQAEGFQFEDVSTVNIGKQGYLFQHGMNPFRIYFLSKFVVFNQPSMTESVCRTDVPS